MITVLDALKQINGYPIPLATLETALVKRGLDSEAIATSQLFRSKEFRLAEADMYSWLADAPNVSQEGISYSFTETERKKFRERANKAYSELSPEDLASAGTVYGYKGDRL